MKVEVKCPVGLLDWSKANVNVVGESGLCLACSWSNHQYNTTNRRPCETQAVADAIQKVKAEKTATRANLS